MAIESNVGLAGIVPADGLIDVNGLWYNQKDLTLDGYRFIGCRFDLCSLYISTTRFELINCFIDDKTLTYYSNEILKVIKLFNSRNKAMYDNYPYFAPMRNIDGTITISGEK
ncbi:hypothetical protein [Providencia sp. Je.9.19]|uniref:hypothetical protein n=1 Tax=Providencia sp. Je.9.19 TaxID=3142844 RepID=UPI003DAA0012